MDKNIFNKTLNFFKKEGFYVILFVCLCVVATIAVLTAKNNKHSNTPVQQNNVSQQNEKKQVAKAENEPSLNYDNALQVKKNTKSETVAPKSETSSQGVSSSVSTTFQKPVDGSIARGYSEDPVYWDSTGSYRPNLGYEIKADLGKSVFAVADGKIEEVNSVTQDGVEIVVNHQNGLKTVYSNLDPKVKVTKGQTVAKGTVIGTVGKSTLRAAYEKYGDHLHFAVLKGKDFVDPSKYIKY
ncbi:M23 family metallopeptidase [Clostridium sp. DJ247]|uniref:M23 family metallopeptidase n=1 Tax=Clostridium sp. DJ247 TaxID=2726188 RepID=UPI0016291626|nr:M23 family metallopeptidase [Clostridium sp. DJ247]MBC2579841.1 M23 family metallopeptidase [Clostridium sp. DJ247]